MPNKDLIKAALLHYAEQVDGWGSFGFYTNYYSFIGKTYDIAGLGEVKVVAGETYDSDKNYDGWHEDLWVVFDIQGILYKATGTYTSYEGSEWNDELTVVIPKEKTVIEYEEEKDDSNTK